MKIEYLIDKDDYKELLPKGNFTAANELIVKKRSNTVKGKDNYLLTLKVLDETEKGAEALSEYHIQIKQILLDNKITFRILLNESAQYFAKELFPLFCEFETKLRKFIQSAMFDINEEAEKIVLKKANKFKGGKGKISSLNGNFLEYADLGEIIDFLFANDDMYAYLKELQQEKRYISQEELIELIKNFENKRAWDKYFSEEFSDSILPEKIFKIKEYRNDTMHFHEIDFEMYCRAKETLKLVVSDIDKQIAKKIVLEAEKYDIEGLANSLSYINTFYFNKHFKDWAKILDDTYLKTFTNIKYDFLKDYQYDNIIKNFSSGLLDCVPTLDALKLDKLYNYYNMFNYIYKNKENSETDKTENTTEEDSEEDKKDGE